jgi:hypothetical protein
VRLPDGRVVTLKRYQKFGGPHEIGYPSTETDYWLEFKSPVTGKIVRYDGDRNLGTVALMFEHGTPACCSCRGMRVSTRTTVPIRRICSMSSATAAGYPCR